MGNVKEKTCILSSVPTGSEQDELMTETKIHSLLFIYAHLISVV